MVTSFLELKLLLVTPTEFQLPTHEFSLQTPLIPFSTFVPSRLRVTVVSTIANFTRLAFGFILS